MGKDRHPATRWLESGQHCCYLLARPLGSSVERAGRDWCRQRHGGQWAEAKQAYGVQSIMVSVRTRGRSTTAGVGTSSRLASKDDAARSPSCQSSSREGLRQLVATMRSSLSGSWPVHAAPGRQPGIIVVWSLDSLAMRPFRTTSPKRANTISPATGEI